MKVVLNQTLNISATLGRNNCNQNKQNSIKKSTLFQFHFLNVLKFVFEYFEFWEIQQICFLPGRVLVFDVFTNVWRSLIFYLSVSTMLPYCIHSYNSVLFRTTFKVLVVALNVRCSFHKNFNTQGLVFLKLTMLYWSYNSYTGCSTQRTRYSENYEMDAL